MTGEESAQTNPSRAADGAETRFPTLPEPEQALCTGDVKTVLAAFFPETADSLFSDLTKQKHSAVVGLRRY